MASVVCSDEELTFNKPIPSTWRGAKSASSALPQPTPAVESLLLPSGFHYGVVELLAEVGTASTLPDVDSQAPPPPLAADGEGGNRREVSVSDEARQPEDANARTEAQEAVEADDQPVFGSNLESVDIPSCNKCEREVDPSTTKRLRKDETMCKSIKSSS